MGDEDGEYGGGGVSKGVCCFVEDLMAGLEVERECAECCDGGGRFAGAQDGAGGKGVDVGGDGVEGVLGWRSWL